MTRFVIINPGSGPVGGADATSAAKTFGAFLGDLIDRGVRIGTYDRAPERNRDGRYSYDLTASGRTVRIDMPGLPVQQVRWTGDPGQDALDFPRLFVDGESWLWRYALEAVIGGRPKAGR